MFPLPRATIRMKFYDQGLSHVEEAMTCAFDTLAFNTIITFIVSKHMSEALAWLNLFLEYAVLENLNVFHCVFPAMSEFFTLLRNL